MAFNLTAAVHTTAPGKLAFPDGSELNFEYFPNAYTPDHEDAIEAAKDANRGSVLMKAMLNNLLHSWDVEQEVPRVDSAGKPVLDDDGKQVVDLVPVPCDDAGFGLIPYKILGDIHRAIIDAVTVGETKSTPSEGSFS